MDPLPQPLLLLGVYYLWEKLGPGNPAFSPLQCAQVTLDLMHNSLILCSQTLEPASDQETPDAGLVGKANLITAKVEASFGILLGRSSRGHAERRGDAVRWGSGLDPSLPCKVLPAFP